MAGIPLGSFLRNVRQRLGTSQTDGDSALLKRFTEHCEEDAFAALLGRYGPLVLRVCRQVLAGEHDVEDAFQATFVVLAHKAGSIHDGKPLAPWLHGVACRVAMECRRRNARRHHHEHKRAAMHSEEMVADVERQDQSAVLHHELDRLPAKYRQPLVLCYLDGQTHDQAAARLGWPVGTVRTRLSRGRDLLHSRLVRRGVTLSTGAVAGVFFQAEALAVPAVLCEATLKAVMLVAAGDVAAAGISANVVLLVQGVLRTMFLSKLKVTGVVLIVLAIVGTSLGYFWPRSQAAGPVVALRASEEDRVAEQIRALLPEAASSSIMDWKNLAKPPAEEDAEFVPKSIKDFENQSLSMVLICQAGDKEDFKLLTNDTMKLVLAISKSQSKGYGTVIQPEFITNCTGQVKGDVAEGVLSFRAEGVYEGKIGLVARRVGGKWQIEEFHLRYGLKVKLQESGKWRMVKEEKTEAGR